jgi:hypothetical protein
MPAALQLLRLVLKERLEGLAERRYLGGLQALLPGAVLALPCGAPESSDCSLAISSVMRG